MGLSGDKDAKKVVMCADIRHFSVNNIAMNDITYFNPTGTSGPDGYINYKMSGGDRLGSSGGPECGFIGWAFTILMLLWVIGKLFG